METNNNASTNSLSPEEQRILTGFRLLGAECKAIWLTIADAKISEANIARQFFLVKSGVDSSQAKRKRRGIACPRQITKALEDVQSGKIACLVVIASIKDPERMVQVSIDPGSSFTSRLDTPFLESRPNSVKGNVITLGEKPSKADEIRAIGEAFQKGLIQKIHIVAGYANRTVKNMTLEMRQTAE